MDHTNHTYVVEWTRGVGGAPRLIEKKGIQELSEFIRNCDAYNRVITKIQNISLNG